MPRCAIAGIKEGLYDMETLASYLLYRLNVLDPICKSYLFNESTYNFKYARVFTINGKTLAPAYLQLLLEDALPTNDLEDFLTQLAQRMGMIKRGAELDLARAAMYFVRWWREEGSLIAASSSLNTGALSAPDGQCCTQGWGFDFQWQLKPGDVRTGKDSETKMVQEKMEACIDEYLKKMEREDTEENNVSVTQIKKQQVLEQKMKRKLKHARR